MTEYLAENSRLRQLSRRYADGQLELREYRAARREILDALEAGQTQAAVAAPLAEEKPRSTFDATDIRLPDDSTVFYKTMPPRVASAESASIEPVAVAAWDSNTRMLAVVLSVSLLLALGALFYVFAL